MSQQNDFRDIREEVYHLTELSLRGEISTAELAQLEQLLASTGDALGHYLEYVSQSAALGVWAAALSDSGSPKQNQNISLPFPGDILGDAPVGLTGSAALPAETLFRGPSSFMSGWWQPLGFVFGVLVASLVFSVWLTSQKLAGNAQSVAVGRNADEKSPAVTPVAYLTSSTGCAWGNGSLKLQTVGSTVQLGDEISLQEGIAEFRLANGVFISVEGPAGLVLTSPDSLVLQYGKLTTNIPWSVKEFRVLAGACRLLASDAEFGVSVNGGRVETHVFTGEVLATNALIFDDDAADLDDNSASPSPSDMFTRGAISQGRALTLVIQNGAMKALRWEKATPALFATKLTMAGTLPISKAYTDAVMASKPKGYWRFESTKNGVVVSEVPGISDLKVVGDLRLSGLAGNKVAEMRPGSDCYLVSRERLDVLSNTEYSMEIWVKPSHVHSGDVLAMCAKEQDWNTLLIELQGNGNSQPRSSFSRTNPCSIRFLHRDPPAGSFRAGTSLLTKKPYNVRRWQHVVAVKRGEQLELYVDGVLAAQGVDKTTLSPELRLVVGRQDPNENILPFSGQLDELAIYSRALTQEEIQTHCKLIDWTQTKTPSVDPKES